MKNLIASTFFVCSRGVHCPWSGVVAILVDTHYSWHLSMCVFLFLNWEVVWLVGWLVGKQTPIS